MKDVDILLYISKREFECSVAFVFLTRLIGNVKSNPTVISEEPVFNSSQKEFLVRVGHNQTIIEIPQTFHEAGVWPGVKKHYKTDSDSHHLFHIRQGTRVVISD